MSAPGELVLSQDEVREFGYVMLSEDYARDERDYKVAVREVMSRLLAPHTLSGSEFPRLLSDFFERELDLAEIGIEGDVAARVEGAVLGAPFYGITNAFINLAGGRFVVNNFIWVPAAIEKGFGEEARSAFAGLVDRASSAHARYERETGGARRAKDPRCSARRRTSAGARRSTP